MSTRTPVTQVSPTPDTFSESEYRADAARVIAHAVKTGRAVVVRDDGSVRVVISIPKADKP